MLFLVGNWQGLIIDGWRMCVSRSFSKDQCQQQINSMPRAINITNPSHHIHPSSTTDSRCQQPHSNHHQQTNYSYPSLYKSYAYNTEAPAILSSSCIESKHSVSKEKDWISASAESLLSIVSRPQKLTIPRDHTCSTSTVWWDYNNMFLLQYFVW